MNAPIGVSRSALRVAVSRIVSAEPDSLPDLAKTERICECHRRFASGVWDACPVSGWSAAAGLTGPAGRESKDLSSRDERSILPRCHPHSAMPLSGRRAGLSCGGRARGPCRRRLPPIGAALYRWRSAPEPTGEPWKLAVWSGGSRVHSLLVAAPASTNRWFSLPAPGGTRPDHSPYSDVARSLWGARRGVNFGPCRGRFPTRQASGRYRLARSNLAVHELPNWRAGKAGTFRPDRHHDRATTRSSHSSAAQLARRRVDSRESQRTCPADHYPGLFLVKSVGSVGRNDPARRMWQPERSRSRWASAY